MGAQIIIGSRGSQLALWQAEWVKATLEALHAGLTVAIQIIKTKGDKILDVPLAQVGGKGLFVKEIEEALLDGRVDLAVHSMKDMPGEVPDGLCIGAIPERENPYDVLIANRDVRFAELPKGARIGTSSLRRSAQLLHARPDLAIVPLRGNLDTRLRKLKTDNLDAIILAAAGVRRLGLEAHITEYIDAAVMLPAVGQGALCIETRVDDPRIAPLVAPLDHADTNAVVTAERAFLHYLEGSCQVPIAAHGKIDAGDLQLTGLVSEVDGSAVVTDTHSGPATAAAELGVQLARKLLDKGADRILENFKSNSC